MKEIILAGIAVFFMTQVSAQAGNLTSKATGSNPVAVTAETNKNTTDQTNTATPASATKGKKGKTAKKGAGH